MRSRIHSRCLAFAAGRHLLTARVARVHVAWLTNCNLITECPSVARLYPEHHHTFPSRAFSVCSDTFYIIRFVHPYVDSQDFICHWKKVHRQRIWPQSSNVNNQMGVKIKNFVSYICLINIFAKTSWSWSIDGPKIRVKKMFFCENGKNYECDGLFRFFFPKYH